MSREFAPQKLCEEQQPTSADAAAASKRRFHVAVFVHEAGATCVRQRKLANNVSAHR
jgi:hypothetical protein